MNSGITLEPVKPLHSEINFRIGLREKHSRHHNSIKFAKYNLV